ncbi:FUSC family protein [Plantactinospora sonchi]|uniref:FUSC family protein n=1 Tax=Plantactinospora sonchi TaxID=1544735 RepID=A0ABU7RP00_9ACTN
MTRIGVLRWLRRRDPGYDVLRRGLRLTVVAAAGLFGGTYGLGDPLLGLYTLFSAIATGLISQLPGGPAQRIRALAVALPVALALVTLGSLLAVNTWAAASGMLVVGFVVAFASAGGPRILGLATGLQLFYIASSFPPYQPGALPSRLGGVALGIVLLILAERVLWPEPGPAGYRDRLAEASGTLADYLDLVAELPSGDPVDDAELTRRRAAASRAVAGVSLARFPPTQRPASAGARDRALRHGVILIAQILAQADRLRARSTGIHDEELTRLLRRVAHLMHSAAGALAGATAPVGEAELARLAAQIQHGYDHPPIERTDPARTVHLLRIDAIALRLADSVRTFGLTTRIADGLKPPPEPGPDDLFYARRSAVSLYWQQLQLHLTTRSVYLQGALRVAVALTVARVVAGFLNLNHGFWVLLAILTLMRTSAVDTRKALRSVLLGTLLGAAVGTLLLTAAHVPELILVALPVMMVLTFAIGPLLPQLWGQALFTVLFVLVFVEVGPANLEIAGARLLDVAIGAAVGVLAGVLLWPKGGSGEVRRSVAQYLEMSASTAEGVVARLAGRSVDVDVSWRRLVLAEASFLQYQSERHDRWLPPVDWMAAVVAANYLHLGALFRLRRGAAGRLTRVAGAADRLEEYAGRIRRGYVDLAHQLHAGHLRRRVPAPAPPDDFTDEVQAVLDAGEPPSAVLNLVDVEVWLYGAGDNLDRIQPAPEEFPAADNSPAHERSRADAHAPADEHRRLRGRWDD